MNKYIHTQALVIKRHNYNEADRFITLLTRDYGKISCLAKGVRKISSRKRSSLEPLNVAKVAMIETKSGYILTEATALINFNSLRQTLPRLTQASQFLEIVDGLIAEAEPHEWLYHQTISIIKAIDEGICDRQTQLLAIRDILVELGFGVPPGDEVVLKNHIEEITQRPLRSKHFYLGVS